MYKKCALTNTGKVTVRYMAGIIMLGSLTLVGGCGLLSGTGPRISNITSDSNIKNPEYPYQLIDLSPANIVPYMRPTENRLLAQVARPVMPEVHLVPGDVLKVLISDDSGADKTIFAPLAQGGTVFEQVRVDASGRISLPYVGSKYVKGATLAQVEDVIRRGVSGRASEPQVYVELVKDLSDSVLVVGAVKTPGRYSSLQGPLTILDAINRAGGPVLEPYLISVTLRTGKEVHKYNYQDLISGGNVAIPLNSEIVLERDRKRFVAMGAVNKPGLTDFPSSSPSLLEVLGTIGGLNERTANPSGVFVFRLDAGDGADRPVAKVFRLDMHKPVSMFLAKNFLIQPDDTVYVTNAPVYEMEKIIAPIVQVLVLGRTADGF